MVMKEIEAMGRTWDSVAEKVGKAAISTDIIAALDLAGTWCAVVGPWYFPYDALAFTMAYHIGSENGMLLSVDPQGDHQSMDVLAHGSGDSRKYKEQLEHFARLGVPVASLTWLGPQSEFAHFTDTGKMLDVVADHGLVEFFHGRYDTQYIQEGLAEVAASLRTGGWYVHFGIGPKTFSQAVGGSSVGGISRLESLGFRVMTKDIERDEYRLALEPDVSDRLQASEFMKKGISIEHTEGGQVRLIISEDAIRHSRRWVILAQKVE